MELNGKKTSALGRVGVLRRLLRAGVGWVFVSADKRSRSGIQNTTARRLPDGFLLSHPLDLFSHVSDARLYETAKMPHTTNKDSDHMTSNGSNFDTRRTQQEVYRWRFSLTRDFSTSYLSVEAPCWLYRILQRLILGVRWRKLDEKKPRKTIGH